jgi:glutamate formiminotransferase
VKEYGIAQVSMNLTNIEETPLHAAFDACVESAAKRGLRVTGSEIVGMVPKNPWSMLAVISSKNNNGLRAFRKKN